MLYELTLLSDDALQQLDDLAKRPGDKSLQLIAEAIAANGRTLRTIARILPTLPDVAKLSTHYYPRDDG